MITRIFRVLCEPAFRFRSTPSVYEETEEPTRSVPPEDALWAVSPNFPLYYSAPVTLLAFRFPLTYIRIIPPRS